MLLFFVLSGFVLSLPFLKSAVPYTSFTIKRIIRIYFPYLVAITVAILAFNSKDPIQGYGEWIKNLATGTFEVKGILENLLLVGNYDSDRYNPVIWSLVHEMRISLFFPIIALLIVRLRWTVNLVICLGLSTVSSLNLLFHWEPYYGFQSSFLLSLHLSALFIIGGLVAKHRKELVGLYVKLPQSVKYVFLLLSMILYTYAVKMRGVTARLGMESFGEMAQDYALAAGIVIFLVIALGSKKMTAILELKVIRFFGDVSYSLYLWHVIILIGSIRLLQGQLPAFAIIFLAIVATFIVSWLSYRYIELPSIRFGKKLTAKRTKESGEISRPVHTGLETAK